MLVVLIDEDGQTVPERKRQVEHSCWMQQLGQQPRSAGERTAIIVPMRHIEGWFEFVVNGACDETEKTRYKNRYRQRARPKRWGGLLASRCQKATDEEIANWPSALQDACEEAKRLEAP